MSRRDSHGADESARLRANVEERMETLLQQLQDLSELREELDDDEYEETKADTLAQLEELRKLIESDMSLVDELGSMRLAIQAAVKEAFKTPEVIRMFAKGEPTALRTKLRELKEAKDLGRIEAGPYKEQAAEVLIALQKMGETLSAEEQGLLSDAKNVDAFVAAEADLGESARASILSQAS